MKQHLQWIVKEHHYDSVKDFMRDYNACKTEYDSYQKAMKQGGKPERSSVRGRLKLNKQVVRKREQGIQQTVNRPQDRGADRRPR